MKVRKMPLKLYRRIAAASWKLRLPNVEAPPGQIEFVLHPWIASNEKLKTELGWTPRYTSRETFEITMRAKGLGPPARPGQRAGARSGASAGRAGRVVQRLNSDACRGA